MFYEVDKKKFKFTYEHGNSYERFKIELFDGEKLNIIATLMDLGEKRNTSAYSMEENESMDRSAMFNAKAKKYVETLLKV